MAQCISPYLIVNKRGQTSGGVRLGHFVRESLGQLVTSSHGCLSTVY